MTYLKTGLVTLICAALLAGCQSILPSNDPERTFAFRYDGQVPQSKDNAPVIFLDDPLMAEGLGGQTLTVVLDGGERTALNDLRWATGLESLIRDYLDRRLMAGTDADYVGDGGLDIRATCRLHTKFWAFEMRPGVSAADDQVAVSLEASLVSLTTGELLARTQLDEVRPTSAASTSDVVMSLEGALSTVSDQLTDFMSEGLKYCR